MGQDEIINFTAKETVSLGNSEIVRRGKLLKRKLWLKVHSFLALTVGFLFVILGLTGTCNVFFVEIDEFLNPELIIKNRGGNHKSLDEIMQSVKASHPTREGSWQLFLPMHPSGVLRAEYHKAKEKIGRLYAPLMVSVNPYTGEVVASRFWGETLMTWIYEVHADLWLDRPGFWAVGVLGALLLVSLLTGVFLWLPSWGKFKKALTIKSGSSKARKNYDFHRVTGLYSAVVLLTLSFTGFYLVFPDVVKPVVNIFSTVTPEPKDLKSTGFPKVSPIKISEAVRVARKVFPSAELKAVKTPEGEEGVFKITLHQDMELTDKFPGTKVWVDQYSGKVLAIRDPKLLSAGDSFLNIQFPLHAGEVLGITGRIIVFISGIAPLVLYITGISMWRKRRRSQALS